MNNKLIITDLITIIINVIVGWKAQFPLMIQTVASFFVWILRCFTYIKSIASAWTKSREHIDHIPCELLVHKTFLLRAVKLYNEYGL